MCVNVQEGIYLCLGFSFLYLKACYSFLGAGRKQERDSCVIDKITLIFIYFSFILSCKQHKYAVY